MAGRQRMLVQRMTRAVCFAMAGIDRDHHIQMAKDAIALFEESQAILRGGDAERLFPAEVDVETIALMDIVDRKWATISAASQQILEEDLHNVVLSQAMYLTDTTMSAANDVVQSLVSRSEGGIDPALALTIDRAGRQRMFSQRIAKQFCFVVAGAASEKTIESMRETLVAFDATLFQLQRGENGLVRPPNLKVAQRLITVRRKWAELKVILEAALAGEVIDAKTKARAGKLSDEVLKFSNLAVVAYSGGS